MRSQARHGQRLSGMRISERQKERRQASAESISHMMRHVRLASALHQLFDSEEPALEFGGFAAFNGPPGSPFQDEALVQYDMRPASLRSMNTRRCRLYFHLTRGQLQALRDIKGDDARMALLVGSMGVRIVGRDGLQDLGILHAVLNAHGISTSDPKEDDKDTASGNSGGADDMEEEKEEAAPAKVQEDVIIEPVANGSSEHDGLGTQQQAAPANAADPAADEVQDMDIDAVPPPPPMAN